MRPVKIVSGGQTGADRAALDFALESEIACGGWCPGGRLAEDGRIPDRYPLRETPGPEAPPRTRRNVEDSDATVVFNAPGGAFSPGTMLTIQCCKDARKPCIVLAGFPDAAADAAALREFLTRSNPAVLNVAGNRESGTPGIYSHVLFTLRRTFGREMKNGGIG